MTKQAVGTSACGSGGRVVGLEGQPGMRTEMEHLHRSTNTTQLKGQCIVNNKPAVCRHCKVTSGQHSHHQDAAAGGSPASMWWYLLLWVASASKAAPTLAALHNGEREKDMRISMGHQGAHCRMRCRPPVPSRWGTPAGARFRTSCEPHAMQPRTLPPGPRTPPEQR